MLSVVVVAVVSGCVILWGIRKAGLTFAIMGAQAAREAKATMKEVAIFILNDWFCKYVSLG